MAKIDKTYHDLLNKIIKEGYKYEDPNRKNIYRYQIPSYQIEHDLQHSFPAITTKKLFWKGVVGELLWILRGDTNIKHLVDNGINIWNKDAYNYYLKQAKESNINNPYTLEEFLEKVKSKESTSGYTYGNLGKVYGAQWRNWYDTMSLDHRDYHIDQISNLIKGLKETPMSTKHIVTAWNPAELDDMALPPCHWSFEILVEPLFLQKRKDILFKNNDDRYTDYENAYLGHISIKEFENKIEDIPKYQFTLKWHQRSVDTFLGLPFNIASYALLAHIIGKLTNMIPKSLIGDLSNVHIYEPHMDAVKTQLKRSVNYHNSECQLEDFGGFKMDMNGDFDQWLNSKEIKDFKLTPHTEQPQIKAEMLSYNK